MPDKISRRNPFCCFGSIRAKRNFEATFLSISPGSLTVATPRNLLRELNSRYPQKPAANRRRGGAGREQKTRALQLAQKKQVVDVPRQQREQHEDDAV